jgi:hypothetical protein
VAQEPAQPVGAPAYAARQPCRREPQDRAGIPHPPRLSGTLRPARQNAEAFLKKWYWWATHSRLPPIIQVARMVKRHWNGILRWFHSKIANGIMEAINSLIQAAKAKARGYRSTRNLKAIIYLIAGRLELALPTSVSEEPSVFGQERNESMLAHELR